MKYKKANQLIVLVGLLFLLVACKATPLEKAREQVEIGDLRTDAVTALTAEAWYHQSCYRLDSIVDLFFYNSHKYDKADIVIVTSLLKNKEYRVSDISSFEPYLWHSVYSDCIDRSRFEN